MGSFLFISISFSLNAVGLTFKGASNWAGTLETSLSNCFFHLPLDDLSHLSL